MLAFLRPAYPSTLALAALLFSSVAAATLHAQAPVIASSSVSSWPSAGSVDEGTNLLLSTDRNYGVPYECKLEKLDSSGITCRGPHHRPVTYERARVQTISVQTQHLRHAYVGFVIGAAMLAAGGVVCAFAAGGVGCAVALSAGLGSGLVAGILHSILELRRPGEPTPIYIAPVPAGASGAAA